MLVASGNSFSLYPVLFRLINYQLHTMTSVKEEMLGTVIKIRSDSKMLFFFAKKYFSEVLTLWSQHSSIMTGRSRSVIFIF